METPWERRYLTVVFVSVSLLIYYLDAATKIGTDRAKSGVLPLSVGNRVRGTDHLAPLFDREYHLKLLSYAVVILLIALSSVYILDQFETLRTEKIGLAGLTYLDIGTGFLIICAVLYATVREFGSIFGGVVFASIGYAYFGPYLPGILHHDGFDIVDIAARNSTNLTGGVYDPLVGVVATWVAMFVIFAGFIQGFDGLEWLRDAAKLIGDYSSTGPTQSAVLTSLGFGIINGSGSANSAITGSITIPTMKNAQKLPPKQAGAIEAVASTGGQIMPPILGAAAFLMADLTGIAFSTIVLVSIMPALIFFLAIYYICISIAMFHGEPVIGQREIDGKLLMLQGTPFLISVVVLVYYLVIVNLGILISGLYANAALFISYFGYKLSSDGISLATGLEFGRQVVTGAQEGMITTARIGIAVASIGIIVTILGITALAPRMAIEFINIAGGNLIVLLVLTMIMAIALGLGTPPLVAYAVTATVLVTPLTNFGIPELQAHFFVFYFAITSMITPPVGLSAVITSDIAGSDYIPTAVEAVKIGLPLYILPYMFIYHGLIPINGAITLTTMLTGAIVFVGILLLMIAVYPHALAAITDERVHSVQFKTVATATAVVCLTYPLLLPLV